MNQQDNISNKTFFIPEGVSPCWKLSLKERVDFILSLTGNTHSWLADEVGINKGTLSKVLNGSWIPTAKIKLLISQKLNVDSLVLFGDQEYFLDYQKTIKAKGDGAKK